jgi:opacity protein-like surface antigen
MRVEKIFAGLCLLLIGSVAHAQELWSGLTLRAKLSKHWTGEVEQQIRFREVISGYNGTFTEIGLRYRLTNHLGVKGSYRYTNRTGSKRADSNDQQRWSGDVFGNIGSSRTRFVFSLRARYQTSQARNSEEPSKDYFRQRISLDYNLTKKVQPYADYEVFYRFNNKNEIQLLRFTLGLKSTISQRLGLDTFYRVENEKNVKRPEKAYVIGAMLTYKFDLRRKNEPSTDAVMPTEGQ